MSDTEWTVGPDLDGDLTLWLGDDAVLRKYELRTAAALREHVWVALVDGLGAGERS